MTDDPMTELRCLVEGQDDICIVRISRNQIIDHLRQTIYEMGRSSHFVGCSRLDLVITKVDVNCNADFQKKIKYGQYWPTFNDRVLYGWERISDIWERPPDDYLHIFVNINPARLHGSTHGNHRRQPPLLPPSDSSLRSNMVSVLHEKLEKYGFVLARGTPASGKTTLALLLAHHIHQQEPAAHIIYIPVWPLRHVRAVGGWERYLTLKYGWAPDEKTFLIFDDAQTTYEDYNLWNELFKNISTDDNQFAAAFAGYGSPTSHLIIHEIGTRVVVSDWQRVTLRQTDHDGLGSVGLLFSQTEFDDLVRTKFASTRYYFDPSFLKFVFEVTGGHVGAIHEFLKVIAGHDSYRRLKHTPGQLYTLGLFMAKFSPHDLLVQLDYSGSTFTKGLPPNDVLEKPAFARIFSEVLRTGSIVQSDPIIEDRTALDQCYRNGWLHADKVSNTRCSEEIVYVLPSPLHRWFVEWKLFNSVPTTPLGLNSIFELAVKVISGFSPSLLSAERRIGPGCIQRPLEAQYQDEFCRSCHAYSDGLLRTFPEFGATKGRADFYIPSMQWGVELVREGDRLEQHSGRFSQSGSYASTLLLSDYIILDFRNTRPEHPHPNIPKLYHVVFCKDYQEVVILDCFLQPVPGGDMRLLDPA